MTTEPSTLTDADVAEMLKKLGYVPDPADLPDAPWERSTALIAMLVACSQATLQPLMELHPDVSVQAYHAATQHLGLPCSPDCPCDTALSGTAQ